MSKEPFVEYVENGWVIAPLRKGEKAPRGQGWSQRELCYSSPGEAAGMVGGGLAHAYSGTCAVDIDDLAQAREFLAQRGVDIDALANDPRAVRISSGRENRLKLLYALPEPRPSRKWLAPSAATGGS